MSTVPQLDINALVKARGYVGAMDVMIARTQAWPTNPNDPKYPIRLKLARELVPVAVSWSAKSRKLLVATREHIEAYTPTPIPAITAYYAIKVIVEYHNVMLADEQKLTAIAAAPAADLLYFQEIVIRLLQDARAGYKVVEAYKASPFWYKLTSLISAIIDVAQGVLDLITAILNAIADFFRDAAGAFGWLKWVALGLGGLYVYDKLIKKRERTA